MTVPRAASYPRGMLRPTLIACPECACHVRSNDETCPHCGAAFDAAIVPAKEGVTIKRAAVAVTLGLAVSVAQLSACDDGPGTGGAGGATTSSGTKSSSASMMGSGSSAIAAYGVAQTSTGSMSGTSSSGTAGSTGTGN